MKLHSSQDMREQGYDAAAFCSTKQAATLLGVSHRTVQLWVESGILQAWKTAGGHRRITLSSVNRLVDQRSVAIQRPLAQTEGAARRKLLLVDDDPTALRLYEAEIGGWDLGLQVVKASNGFEALIRIGEARPELLISELSLPGIDGLRMIRTLRADPSYGAMGIIVLSSLGRETAQSMGLPEEIPVLAKPVPFADLRRAVERVLGAAA